MTEGVLLAVIVVRAVHSAERGREAFGTRCTLAHHHPPCIPQRKCEAAESQWHISDTRRSLMSGRLIVSRDDLSSEARVSSDTYETNLILIPTTTFLSCVL